MGIRFKDIDNSRRVGLIGLTDVLQVNELFTEFEKILSQKFSEGYKHFVIDLELVEYPTSKLIALLIASTQRARETGGEVKLVNVSDTARNNILTFNPLTFLSAEEDLESALNDLHSAGESHVRPTSAPEFNSQPEPEPEPQPEMNTEPLALPARLSPGRIRVRSQVDQLYDLCDFVTEHAERIGFDEKDIGKIRIAVYEASLNVVEHAYLNDPNQSIDLLVKAEGDRLEITMTDRGIGFDFNKPKQYDVEQAVQDRKTGGFGRYIISRSMDKVEYGSDPQRGNVLRMTKVLRRKSQRSERAQLASAGVGT